MCIRDSNSIVNQKAILKKYAQEQGFRNIQFFVDDGYSGANFNRPDWKRMIELVENDKVGVIIAKDMSRIGRNYREVGLYTEKMCIRDRLNTLWVDKNLKMHGLIQAFSRTNRILNSVKTFGNIVCFRDLEKETNEAIALFGDKEANGIVLLKSYEDYYYGCVDDKGREQKGYFPTWSKGPPQASGWVWATARPCPRPTPPTAAGRTDRCTAKRKRCAWTASSAT